MSNFASRIIRTKGNKLLVPRHKRSTNDSYHKAVTDASGIVFEEFLQHVKIQEVTSKKKKLDIWIHILSFIDDKGTDKSIVVYNQFRAFWCKHENLFISKEMRTQSEGVLK